MVSDVYRLFIKGHGCVSQKVFDFIMINSFSAKNRIIIIVEHDNIATYYTFGG